MRRFSCSLNKLTVLIDGYPSVIMVCMRHKTIPGFDGIYTIYEDGRIWSKARNGRRGRFLNPGVGTPAYYCVTLSIKNKAKGFRILRLLAQAFIPNPDNLPEVNHMDGNKLNNNLSNLEWCTSLHNLRHEYLTGLSKLKPRYGKDNPNTVLNPEQVMEIRAIAKLKIASKRAIGRAYGIGVTTVRQILNNEPWQWIDDVSLQPGKEKCTCQNSSRVLPIAPMPVVSSAYRRIR
jgi:hypothetical protein